MIVVAPNIEAIDISIIPRFEPVGSLTVTFFNETTKESFVKINSYDYTDGFLNVNIRYVYLMEDKKMEFKIENSGSVIYRGKLFATSQISQDYKLTNGLYFYE